MNNVSKGLVCSLGVRVGRFRNWVASNAMGVLSGIIIFRTLGRCN